MINKTGNILRNAFLFEKPKIGQFPLKFSLKLKKSEWYIFPQGWSAYGTALHPVYLTEFRITHEYIFSWLFIELKCASRFDKCSLQLYSNETHEIKRINEMVK